MRSVLCCDRVGLKAGQHLLGWVQDGGGGPAGMWEAPVKEGWAHTGGAVMETGQFITTVVSAKLNSDG